MVGRVGHSGDEGRADVRHVEPQFDEVVPGVIIPLIKVVDDGSRVATIEFSKRDLKISLTADVLRRGSCLL